MANNSNSPNTQFSWHKLSYFLLFAFYLLVVAILLTWKFSLLSFAIPFTISVFAAAIGWGFKSVGYDQRAWVWWESLPLFTHIGICVSTVPWLIYLFKPFCLGINNELEKK